MMIRKTLKGINRFFKRIPFIYILLAIVLLLIFIRTPNFFKPKPFLSWLKRSSPIMIVAMGQAIVMISGEIDLSVGSLITVCAVAAAKVINNDPGRVSEAFLWIVGIALVVGFVNGFLTTKLKVPSFVSTLGMLLILQGAISIITRGTPDGSITENFRFYGKGNIGEFFPAALVITIVVCFLAILIMQYTTFGRKVYSVGGNQMASYLSGVKVDWIKTGAFMICAFFGAIGAVLIAGFSGVSTLSVGEGYEFSAISAAVLSGVSMKGGRGHVGHALTGALTLQAIFVLLNFLSLPIPIRFVVEGLIIIAAMTFTAWREKRILN